MILTPHPRLRKQTFLTRREIPLDSTATPGVATGLGSEEPRKVTKMNNQIVRVGLNNCGPHTACCLLGLWSEGKIDLTLREYRTLVKRISMFLEELEEVRGEIFTTRE